MIEIKNDIDDELFYTLMNFIKTNLDNKNEIKLLDLINMKTNWNQKPIVLLSRVFKLTNLDATLYIEKGCTENIWLKPIFQYYKIKNKVNINNFIFHEFDNIEYSYCFKIKKIDYDMLKEKIKFYSDTYLDKFINNELITLDNYYSFDKSKELFKKEILELYKNIGNTIVIKHHYNHDVFSVKPRYNFFQTIFALEKQKKIEIIDFNLINDEKNEGVYKIVRLKLLKKILPELDNIEFSDSIDSDSLIVKKDWKTKIEFNNIKLHFYSRNKELPEICTITTSISKQTIFIDELINNDFRLSGLGFDDILEKKNIKSSNKTMKNTIDSINKKIKNFVKNNKLDFFADLYDEKFIIGNDNNAEMNTIFRKYFNE